ncbi:hypothetical protein Tco_1443083, partial [Tanacetum coccineum]
MNLIIVTVKIIPASAGIVQATKCLKRSDFREGGQEGVIPTQEYIRKLIEDVGDDDDFTRVLWVSAVEYVNSKGSIASGSFGDMKTNCQNGKFSNVVVVIKSFLTEGVYGNVITIGATLILHNVSVCSPKSSAHYLNLTLRNIIMNFPKYAVTGNASGVGGIEIFGVTKEE